MLNASKFKLCFKKSKQRIAIFILSITVVISLIGESFYASASPAMFSIDVQWANPQKLLSINKTEKKAELTANINGTATKFYLSFPKEGGVRLNTDNTGYFEPKAFYKIDYYKGEDSSMLLKAGDTKVIINYGVYPWSLDFLNSKNEIVYTLSSRNIFFGYRFNILRKVKLSGSIDENEVLYGLGERYNAINQVGKTVKLWNTDTGYHQSHALSDRQLSYTNVPILNSSKGYTVFFNSYYGGIADIGNTTEDWYMDFNGTDFDVYIYANNTEKNLEEYTNLTGKPFVAPKWAFGYWAGQTDSFWSSTGNYSKHVDEVLSKYEKMGTMPSAIYLESMPFNEDALDVANKYGVKAFSWNHPGITLLSNITGSQSMGIENLKKLLPNVSLKDLPAAFLSADMNPDLRAENWGDYSNPNAKQALLNGGYSKLISNGLAGTMIDYGEYQESGWYFYNGMKGDEMHNFNGYCYTKTIYDIFEEKKKGDYVLFARAGAAGSQSFAGLFGGDQASNFNGLIQAYYGGLSAGASGYSNWGSDIGALSGQPSQQLYLRWLQFGAFSPFMRTHGDSDRNPWSYGKLGEKTFTELYNLRYSLIDYLYSANLRAGKTGSSMMKTMDYAFPNQASVAAIEDQYTFGDELLVAPILSENQSYRNVTFPNGRWTDLWTGKTYTKGTQTVNATINTIPVYLRDGAVIKVNVSDKFSLIDSKENKTYEALLVAPTSTEHKATYYTDSKVYNFTNKANDKNSYTVFNDDKYDVKIIIAVGTTAVNVKVDGEELKKLDALPDNDTVKGYYIDYITRRTYIFTGDNWSSVYAADSNLASENLALNATVRTSAESMTTQARNIMDGDYTSAYVPFLKDESDAIIDLGKIQMINSIVLHWNAYSPTSYKLEISTDENSGWIDVNKSNALGGTEEYKINQNARYVRISDIDREGSSVAAGLQELEIYGNSLVEEILIETDNESEDENIDLDYDFELDNSSNEYIDISEPNDENNGESINNKKPGGIYKKILVSNGGFETWAIVLMIVGAAVAVAGITAVVILAVRKKKKS